MTIAQVTQLTHSIDETLIARLFARFRSRYGNLWTSRATCDEDWEFIMDDWQQELSHFSLEQVRAAVNKALCIYKEFPPTLGQLIDLCMAESGAPDVQQLIVLMVKREFNHPLVKMVYDKIGSWTLKNGKETEITTKAKAVYRECMAEFQINPKLCWQNLQLFNTKPKELEAPSKIPSSSESKAFIESMNKCQEILKGKKIEYAGKTYRHYEPNQIRKGHIEFNQAIFDNYKAYLMGIPEAETMILPPLYLMDRNKFLNMHAQREYLKEQGYIDSNGRDIPHQAGQAHRTSQGRPQPIYKNWAHD